MEQVFVFDVDGTLTGPRRFMHEDFARFFRTIVNTEIVYLVSGSDMAKLEEQLPGWLLQSVSGTFTCSGNELWQGSQTIFQMHHVFPDEMLEFARKLVDESSYEARTGNHQETRTGTLNVSVVGRNANPLQRNDYDRYDKESGDRQRMIAAINETFGDYEANRGGQISIDISPRGWNKSRVHSELKRKYEDVAFRFFGDNICDGGNDLPLAEVIMNDHPANKVYPVRDHFETWKILQEEFIASSSQDVEPVASSA